MIGLVRKNIEMLKPYNVCEDISTIKLDANENPFNIFDELKEGYINSLMNLSINRYPETNSTSLIEKLSGYVKMKPKNLICGNGSDEIIQVVINTFVDKDDYVVTHTPTFSMYKVFTQIAGGRVLEVQSDDSFNIDEDEIIRLSNENKAKVIFLCNPNNPTGTVIKREAIIKMLDNTSSIVVVDEAYFEFLGESVADKINKYERLIVLRTLSKGFALAGARIGYGIANEEMINLLLKVKAPYNLNVLSHLIGILFLENKDIVLRKIEEIKKERSYLEEELKKVKNIRVFSSGSNFILIKTVNSDKIIKACIEERIGLRDYKDSQLNNCIRITVGTREENEKLISLINKVVIK
jgi:histidinol-phosphate aminotransferase